jgi:hypothetical protein
MYINNYENTQVSNTTYCRVDSGWSSKVLVLHYGWLMVYTFLVGAIIFYLSNTFIVYSTILSVHHISSNFLMGFKQIVVQQKVMQCKSLLCHIFYLIPILPLIMRQSWGFADATTGYRCFSFLICTFCFNISSILKKRFSGILRYYYAQIMSFH